MDILNCRALKQRTGERLSSASCDHKKLALIHAGIALGAGLVVSLLQLYLNRQIASTGGLAGLGTRTILETVQMVLDYGVNIALPFWEFGFIFVTLCLARGEATGTRDLTRGFRYFGPVIRLYLVETLIYIGVGFACVYAGSFLFTLTPWAAPLQEQLLRMAEEGQSFDQMITAMQALPQKQLLPMIMPGLLIMGALFAVVSVFLFYRFRMARFIVMDEPRAGGIMALLLSSRMTKGCRWKLVRLDFSFWWFWLLTGLSMAAMYADMLLEKMGITLPVSGDMAWIVSYVLGCLIQLVVFWQFNSYVQTVYASAYEELRQRPAEEPKPQPVPQNVPWDDRYQ